MIRLKILVTFLLKKTLYTNFESKIHKLREMAQNKSQKMHSNLKTKQVSDS